MKKKTTQPKQISQTVTAVLSTLAPQASSPVARNLREPCQLTPERLDEVLNRIFSDFQPLGDPELEKALDQAKKFCRDMASGDKPARWITFLGPSGVGKTLLAKRINYFFWRYLDDLLDDRNGPAEAFSRRGGFKAWIDVVNDMLTGDYSGLRDLSDDWFLVLDDIGVEYSRNKELAVSKLYSIMNSRQGLFTVITANLPLEEINDKLDARIASRLLRDGSSVVNVKTEDFNLRN